MARARTSPTIDYFWAEPDPELVAQQILQLSYALDDFRAPLAAAAELSRVDMRQRFKTGTDPSGRPWEEWADSYEPYAMAHTTGPVLPSRANLHLTGDMERALMQGSNWRVTGQDLFLDTSSLPEYWAWNNFGATRRLPKSTREAYAAAGFEPGANELPERPFVGLSVEGRAKINAAFDAWFAGEVAVATSPRGRAFFRHARRGPGGRFVPR
jgi:phage gpG-like protein